MPPQNPLDPQNPNSTVPPVPPQEPVPPQAPVPPVAPPQPGVVQPNLPPQPPVAPTMPVDPMAGQPQPAAYPMTAASSSSGGSKKIILIVIIIVVALLVVGGGVAGFMMLRGGSGGIANPLSGKAKDVVDRPDGTLDLQPLIDEQKTITAQNLTAKLNQQVNMSDGMSFMVTKVERDWQSGDKYDKPKAGNEFVKLTMVVGNRTIDDTISNGFKLKNSAGGEQNDEFISEDVLPDQLRILSDIASGKQQTGTMVFEVTKGEQGLSLVYSEKYRPLGSEDESKNIEVRATVAL